MKRLIYAKMMLLAGAVIALPAVALSEDAAITAFKEVCVASAPDFASAPERARKYVGPTIDAGSLGMMGSADDNSIAVQIKPSKECVITTEDRPNPKALTAEFQTAIFGNGFENPGRHNPIQASISKQTFIFFHDTNGGEAYVMLKK